MTELREEMRRNIGFLIKAFGLRPRLFYEDFYEKAEKLWQEGDLSGCVSWTKECLGLPGIEIDVYILPSEGYDKWRLTRIDKLYDFFWEKLERPKTRDFRKPMRRLFRYDNKEVGVKTVELDICSWVRRLPRETFLFLAVREMALLLIEEVNVKFLRLPGAAEVLAIIFGFDYAVVEGASAGRYRFSLLEDSELKGIEEYANVLRKEQGLQYKDMPLF